MAQSKFLLLSRHHLLNTVSDSFHRDRAGSWTPGSIESASNFWSSHKAISGNNVGDVTIFSPCCYPRPA